MVFGELMVKCGTPILSGPQMEDIRISMTHHNYCIFTGKLINHVMKWDSTFGHHVLNPMETQMHILIFKSNYEPALDFSMNKRGLLLRYNLLRRCNKASFIWSEPWNFRFKLRPMLLEIPTECWHKSRSHLTAPTLLIFFLVVNSTRKVCKLPIARGEFPIRCRLNHMFSWLNPHVCKSVSSRYVVD